MSANNTLTAFIAKHGIRMTAERTDANPNMEDAETLYNRMTHWRCTLRMGRARMTVTYSMGAGFEGRPPKARDVLDSLASDSSGMSDSFEDWCSEYGFDTDSRKAERTYRTCKSQAARLRRFLGDAAYDALLYHTERE